MDRVEAFRAERAAVISFAQDLDDTEWRTLSGAPGWTVHDVIAHLGSACHGLFTPALLTLIRSKDIESTNDVMVHARRSWSPLQVLDEYERWSARVAKVARLAVRSPARHLRLPLAELGSFGMDRLMAGAMVFDHHTHLRHDIAPKLDRGIPGTDPNRLAVVLDWMFAVLRNQLRGADIAWLNRPIVIELRGAGGGSWTVLPGGDIVPCDQNFEAHISSPADSFPAWGTKRSSWRSCDVTIGSHEDVATRLLDSINVV